MPDNDLTDGWPRGWDAHRVAQLTRLAHLSFAEKLAWLEAAHAAVMHLGSRPQAVATSTHTAAGPALPRTRESR